MKIIKAFTICIFISLGNLSFCQYDFLKVSFEFSQAPETNPNHHIFITLHKQDSSFLLSVKSNTIKRNKYKVKESVVDTLYVIEKKQFEEIVIKIENVFTNHIVQKDFYIFTHPNRFSLSIENITGEKINIELLNPSYDTKERDLEQFLEICEDILLLAKIDLNKIL